MAARKAKRIGFIGGGNMATAMIRGLVSAGASPTGITVAEPLASKRKVLSRRFRVRAVADNGEAARRADLLVLAVKPQIIDTVLTELAPDLTGRQLVVSIAAGVPLERLERGLGNDVRVVRVMPNTPSLVGRGAAVLVGGTRARAADLRAAKALFATVGDAHVVGDERLLDAVTAVSGSGPAYVYRFAEVLIEAGCRAGLSPELARALTLQTIAGAAEMMLRSGEEPEALRKAVMSPGGTTVAGLAKLEAGKLRATVGAAVRAAAKRSRELGRR